MVLARVCRDTDGSHASKMYNQTCRSGRGNMTVKKYQRLDYVRLAVSIPPRPISQVRRLRSSNNASKLNFNMCQGDRQAERQATFRK